MTDIVKKDFEKWYFKNHVKSSKKFKELWPHEYHDIYDWFYGITKPFKWGVMVDYYDSVGIRIGVLTFETIDFLDQRKLTDKSFSFFIFSDEGYKCDGCNIETRHEARKAALEKASQIRHEQLTK